MDAACEGDGVDFFGLAVVDGDFEGGVEAACEWVGARGVAHPENSFAVAFVDFFDGAAPAGVGDPFVFVGGGGGALGFFAAVAGDVGDDTLGGEFGVEETCAGRGRGGGAPIGRAGFIAGCKEGGCEERGDGEFDEAVHAGNVPKGGNFCK